MKILHKGAEAILYKKDNNLIKERITKNYRHKVIDKNKTKYPTRREFKLLTKAKELINVPTPIEVDENNSKITMEYLEGDVLKTTLDTYPKTKREKVAKSIGEQIATMHDNNIIHGDLTTSNMILKDNKVYFIDFGLGKISTKLEDKATDLKLLQQAFESKHYKHDDELIKNTLKGYKKSINYKETMERLEKVNKRGRYKRKS
jgi:Kae1-associated kinase Bud32